MRTKTSLLLLFILTSVFIIAFTQAAAPSVGVKPGDWIEYGITHNGTSSPPPTHDVNWMRLEVLGVNGAAFSVNVTAHYNNGTVGSEVWYLNFSEGNVGGWIIIPSNLSLGEAFFDCSIHNHKPVNVTIQGQQQKSILGADRTITYGEDGFRYKEWDKATGFFVGSSETYRNVTFKDGYYIDSLTVTAKACATNLWSYTTPVESQSMFYTIVIVVVLAACVFSTALLIARRRHVHLNPKQQTIISALLVFGLIGAVGFISSTPISESQVPLSFRDINVIMQSLWMALLLLSMWFRLKGNYLVHGILVIVVVAITIMGFLGVLAMSPMDNSSMTEYFGSPLAVAVFLAHAVFSFPALLFGVWLIALWRPSSVTFQAKSKNVAWLLIVFWVLSYIVGILDYAVLRAMLG